MEFWSLMGRKSDKKYHLIVLSSTVLPGTISKLIRLVERISKRKFGEGFGFSYVPDFVKLGSVINDFINPEFFLIGANSWDDHGKTQAIWSHFHENTPPHKYLTLEETEVAKIALNAFIVNKITFANFLGQLCDGMDNVNVHRITDTIGIDKRISPYFFGSGTPYGGTCFPRDTSAFIKFAEMRGREAKHIMFSDEVNENVYQDILHKCDGHDNIGIVGVSFKPDSPVTVGSPSVRLIEDLLKRDVNIFAYDELEETFENLNGLVNDIHQCVSANECVDRSDVIIFMHPTKKYAILNVQDKILVDSWGIFSSEKPRIERTYTPWFFMGMASYMIAFAIWLQGQPNNPSIFTEQMCNPDSLIQPHAIWHLLTAYATWCFFMFFRTEKQISQ